MFSGIKMIALLAVITFSAAITFLAATGPNKCTYFSRSRDIKYITKVGRPFLHYGREKQFCFFQVTVVQVAFIKFFTFKSPNPPVIDKQTTH